MATADFLEARAHELLTAATASLTLARTGNPVPSRIYLSHGPPAVDFCSDNGLLAVYADNPAMSFERAEVDRSMQVGQFKVFPIFMLVVELWRCVPNIDDTGTIPTAAALDASATGLLRDLHALWTGLELEQDAGNLFPAAPGCQSARFGPPIPRQPSGNVAGWLFKIQVPINDALTVPPL